MSATSAIGQRNQPPSEAGSGRICPIFHTPLSSVQKGRSRSGNTSRRLVASTFPPGTSTAPSYTPSGRTKGSITTSLSAPPTPSAVSTLLTPADPRASRSFVPRNWELGRKESARVAASCRSSCHCWIRTCPGVADPYRSRISALSRAATRRLARVSSKGSPVPGHRSRALATPTGPSRVVVRPQGASPTLAGTDTENTCASRIRCEPVAASISTSLLVAASLT